MEMIPLSRATYIETSIEYVRNVLESGKLAGQGPYTQKCYDWLKKILPSGDCFLTTSGTSALEMAAMLLDIKPGDEIIFPSFTYVATVNAFVVQGATPVFVDIEIGTMNVDASKIESAITDHTRAIVPVHYAGIPCDMDAIMAIAKRHGLRVVEDAAQGLLSQYKGKYLGTIGDLGCISFHETKNFTSGGQGGALFVNDPALFERAEVIYDNGTNRVQFLRGTVSQYSWQDRGSNFILPEVLAALLFAHFELSDSISDRRLQLWNKYHKELSSVAASIKNFAVPEIPTGCDHNAHIFYVRILDYRRRDSFIKHMRSRGVILRELLLKLADKVRDVESHCLRYEVIEKQETKNGTNCLTFHLLENVREQFGQGGLLAVDETIETVKTIGGFTVRV
ncbi:hypothetical protein FQN57_004653 [Myotisia sp. PD_48]|nr:hypothetical protein FQN57_004653 [Myotisia sp. PD_48]